MKSVFFSYSHRDQILRDTLETHLTIMKRNGEISAWHDHMIPAGASFDDAISDKLNKADVILLLVSPDFLASDYCYEIENSRALERQREGFAQVIPIILRPCDWKQTPLQKLKCLPLDGNAVTKWDNQDEAFLNITEGIRQALGTGELVSPPSSNPRETSQTVGVQSTVPAFSIPTIRLPKTFTEVDKDRFLKSSFEVIISILEQALTQNAKNDPRLEGDFEKIDATTVEMTLYLDGERKCHTFIHRGGSFGSHSITSGSSRSSNSMSHGLHLAEGENGLHFESLGGMGHHGWNEERKEMSPEQAAEQLWRVFTQPLSY